MGSITLKFKKLKEGAKTPSFAKPGDAGLDLVITDIDFLSKPNFGVVKVGFGLAVEIPKGYVGLLFPRSSIADKQALLTNSVGVIDSGYRGELMAKFLGDESTFGYKVGDKGIQLVILELPDITTEEVDELSESERGTGGFGSTGL